MLQHHNARSTHTSQWKKTVGHTYKTRSYTSYSLKHSSTSAAAAMGCAEAARAKVAFSEKKMQIKIEKAHLKVSLDKLNIEKTAAATLAKVEAFEAALEYENDKNGSKPTSELEFQTHDITQCTQEYVLTHRNM